MDIATVRFEEQRAYLFGIAYRMLGRVMEAEDILQDAYLRFRHALSAGTIQSDRAYLSAIVTRLCMDYLKSAVVQREEYIGPWLPEPLPTADMPEGLSSQSESLSMAFLVVLERLSPLERAVFLLHEVFDYDYAEIAPWLDKSESACRQIFSRAKRRIVDQRPRFQASPAEQAQIFSAFLAACQVGDLAGLKALLVPQASAWSDGGGKVSAATRPLYGAETVARFVLGIFQQAVPDLSYAFTVMNGSVSLVVRQASGQVEVVVVPEIIEAKVHSLRFIRNPDKLRHLRNS